MDSDEKATQNSTPNQPDIEAVPAPEPSQVSLPEPPIYSSAPEDPTDVPPAPTQ